MNLDDGATYEIESRWPPHKQRNCALNPAMYATNYCGNLQSGIQLVRDHHAHLQSIGETTWSMPPELTQLLDALLNNEL